MGEVDCLCFPGARTHDVLAFVESQKIRKIVSGYNKVVIFWGNSVNDFPEQGVIRQAETPSEVLHFFISIINEIKKLRKNVKVCVIGCPNRCNGFSDRIKELNGLLTNLPCEYQFFGLGT